MLQVRTIGPNDIVQVINLMNDQHGEEGTAGYEHNEAAWISNFMVLFHKSNNDDQSAVIGCFDTDDNQLVGFLTADVFVSFYDNRLIADVKDCVTTGTQRGIVFSRLFNWFLDHYSSVGIPDWRFDSIKKSEEDRDRLVDFIKKRFEPTNEIETFVSIRGVQYEIQ